jgi:hypothetical protein
MNRIKKILGLHEHNLINAGDVVISQHGIVSHGVPYAMYFRVDLICSDCGKKFKEKSLVFSESEIYNMHLDAFDVYNFFGDVKLSNSRNGVIVRNLFYKKLNKKYNLNLTINDLSFKL